MSKDVLRFEPAVAAAVAFCLLLGGQSVRAQNRYTGTTQNKQQAQKADGDSQFDSQPLKEKVAIPNLPDYPGRSKFLRGLTFPNALNGPSYVLYFSAEEKRDAVRDWYQRSLPSYEWKVSRATPTSVSAVHKSGDTLNMAFTTGSSQGMSEFKIYYHVIRRH